MIWLGIDTSNIPLSVAVVQNGQVVAEWTNSLKVTHSVGAMPAIEDVLKKVNLRPSDLDAIAVSEGPGSYTGVRIGVTIAKTLAWALKIPLVGVSSLLRNIGFFVVRTAGDSVIFKACVNPKSHLVNVGLYVFIIQVKSNVPVVFSVTGVSRITFLGAPDLL